MEAGTEPGQGDTARQPGKAARQPGRAARRLVGPAIAAGDSVSGGLADAAARRSLAATSVTAICLLIALCAAAWFSGGSGDLPGTVAVIAWLLTRAFAKRLAALGSRPVSHEHTDWLAGAPWAPDRGRAGEAAARDSVRAGASPPPSASNASNAARASARAFGWLSAVFTAAGECAIYGGIAAGGQARGWPGMWPLAVVTVSAVAVADALSACGGSRRRPALATRPGLRVAIATAGLAIHGPRVALFAVIVTEVVWICYSVIRARRLTGDRQVVLAYRDDGPVVRWAGQLVQGNLAPLPPTIAGVAATALLAGLGLGHAVAALAPVVVLLLAAPGSSHQHDGRFDWLVPVVMLVGQFVYLAALGFAWAVPGPIVFSLCAMTVVWYASLGATHHGIGWEARIFVAGLTSIFGIATFGYVGLATYLGVVISWNVLGEVTAR